MKKILNLVIIMLISLSGVTQTYFSERYNYAGWQSLDFSHDILRIDEGYIIPGGFAYNDTLSYNKIGIIKIDYFGDELLSKVIGEGETTYSWNISYNQGALSRDKGNTGYYDVGMKRKYVGTGVGVEDKGVIYRFDIELDTLWTVNIGDNVLSYDTNYSFRHCVVLPNDELIIAGHIVIEGSNSKAMLIKTDSLGNELWRKYFSSGPLNDGINVISTPDGGFVLSAWKWTFGHVTGAPYLIKTDSAGNQEWSKGFWEYDRYHGPLYISISLDSLIVGVYSYSDSVNYPSSDSYNRDAVIKLDLEGNVIWEKKYGIASYNKWVASGTVTPQGKIILTGRTYETYPQRLGYMLNVSPEGDSLWYREYEEVWGVNSHNYLYGVIPTDDGGYAAAGMVHPNGNQDLWVLKVDSLGCESFDYCWTSLPGVISVEKPGELAVFPNPATRSCTIAIPKENQFDTYTLFIYNLMGVKMEEIVVPSGEIQVVLNLSGYAPGLYSVVTSYKGSITGRGKFVVY
ncbi:MAG: hypothetical protein COW63_03680 [Bacteroidetes bacterium CG18_big_fil_WC_8_21_14_2_50_41_14]|nr:MAG: hypothetical protein COW63_03680 [Bacteroidetes bacterium CG18_big_fil_WC_8_21_14_2_50_41_14]